MAINYNDSRFQAVEEEKQQALNNVNNTYGTMINQSDQFYTNQQNLVKDYENTQKEIQQQQSDFTIEQINQQKAQAEQDYTKEQKASYVDYQKQSNQYGANAEAMASRGLNYTGYAESSQVSMYNTYQNRYATARETYNRAVLNYDNGIKEAQLSNSSALAEITFNSMQKQLELALEGFQYKNTLLQTQLQMQNETEDRYYTRWQNVQEQINTENSLAEQQRQFNESMALQREQFNWQKQQAELERQQQARISSARASGSSGGSSGSSSGGNSASIEQKEDYYFSNGYQPQYINDTKVKASGLKVWNVFSEGTSQKNASKFGKQNIWEADGKYYVWDGNSKDYVDVTSKVNESLTKKVNFKWGR